jgi:hypothetical protein
VTDAKESADEAEDRRQHLEFIQTVVGRMSTVSTQLDEFDARLAPQRRNSRLSGMELDAALADPRWTVESGL